MSPLASNSDNIRFNGTGRLYVADVGSARVGMEVGEIDGLSDSYSTSEDKIKSNRTAARSTLKTVKNETEVSLSFGMREQSIENLELAYSADPANITSQLGGAVEALALAMVAKEYSVIGKVSCFTTKLGHGAATGGPFEVGETVSGGDSAATGKIAWVGADYVELINVSGVFSSGETITGSISSASAPVSSVEKLKDVVVCDAASPVTRYVLGTDYQVDADYGYVMKLPDGSLGATVYIWCDHLAMSIQALHVMSAGDVEKRLTFVTDVDDLGPQMRYTYHKVKLTLNGENQKMGDGESILPMQGTVMADSSKPAGQQYVLVEVME